MPVYSASEVAEQLTKELGREVPARDISDAFTQGKLDSTICPVIRMKRMISSMYVPTIREYLQTMYSRRDRHEINCGFAMGPQTPVAPDDGGQSEEQLFAEDRIVWKDENHGPASVAYIRVTVVGFATRRGRPHPTDVDGILLGWSECGDDAKVEREGTKLVYRRRVFFADAKPSAEPPVDAINRETIRPGVLASLLSE